MVYREGDVIDGQFEVLAGLGGGAFGNVYRVRNLADGFEYALKLLDRGGDLESVRREFGALRSLDHPNIAKAHWATRTTDGTWYLATDFVEGETLAVLIERAGPLSPPFVIDLGRQLLSALELLHPDEERIGQLMAAKDAGELSGDEWAELQELQAGGLVHRDIKPENIVIARDGTPVLVDFGICSRAGTLVRTVSMTPGYLPPDMTIAALGSWSPRVDRYALAVVLAECLLGRLGDAQDTAQWFESGIEQIDELSSLPWGTWIGAALGDALAGTFASTTQFRTAWDALAREAEGDRDRPETVEADDGRAFNGWTTRPLPDLVGLDEVTLIDLIVEVVEAEGCVVCRRLYRLLEEAAGSRPVSVLNRAVYKAVRQARIGQVEPLGGGQQDKTVYASGFDPRSVRRLGNRDPWELPDSEVDGWLDASAEAMSWPNDREAQPAQHLVRAATAGLLGLGAECWHDDRPELDDEVFSQLFWRVESRFDSWCSTRST